MRTVNKTTLIVLLFAILLLVNIIGHLIPAQADLTENRLFTLSDGSRNLLAKIEDPVRLEFYFSRSVEDLPIQIKNYATRVEDVLRQYERAADGMIDLEIIDPKPFTEAEEAAARAGISSQALPSGETVMLGLLAIQAEQEELIPYMDLRREEFLEFDISQLLYRVQQLELPRLGIVSALDVVGGPMNPMMMQMGQQPSADWIFVEELRSSFEVESFDLSAEELPDNLDVLVVIHPQNLPDPMAYAIDQHVLAGKPLFLAVDPSSYQQKINQNPQQAMMMGGRQPPTSSDLPRLFDKWGIQYNAQEVVGDLAYAAEVADPRSGGRQRYPVWMQVREFNPGVPVTAQLNDMLFVEAGWFKLADDASPDLTITPLATSSGQSATMMASTLTFSSPRQVADQILPDSIERILAAVISGPFRTAFPEGKPQTEPEPDEDGETPEPLPVDNSNHRTEGEGTIILVADTDFLADQFSARRLNFLGMQALQPLNDNLAFTANVAEYLAGSEDLISLRSKGQASRPFDRVREIELAAQERYKAQLEQLEGRLSEVRQRLRELQQEQTDQRVLVATPEMQATLEEFRDEEAEMLRERREIERKLNEDIERMEFSLATFNLFFMPAMVALYGILFFVNRNRRQSADQPTR